MKIASLPSNETKRLTALNNYHILDTLPEIDFDDLTLIASHVCHAPIAFISFVDETRLWIKSKVGLEVSEIPRDDSFCSHAILQKDVFIVPDSLEDERFSDNPFVKGSPHVRFYAGAPLRTPDGSQIGTLCVIDHVPRKLTDDQVAILQALARQVVTLLDLRIKRESILLSSQLVKSSPAAIFCKDYESGTGVFVEWNQAAEELWALKNEAVIGKTDYDLFPKEQADFFKKKDLETIQSGNRIFIEQEPIDTAKGPLQLRTWKVPVNDIHGKARYLLGISLDITKQVDLEKLLLDAIDLAENAVKTKSAFLANMSHEIRTPLNGIIGMSNLLLGSVSDPMQIERIKIIQRCGNSLLDIINDVLDFSKLEVDKVELENSPFSLGDAVNDVVEILSQRALEKGLSLSYEADKDLPLWITGDITRFRQILTNLVSNAIKFTEKGSVQVFSVAQKTTNTNWQIQFSIKDSGIGIPENLMSKLFLSFSQVDASTTRKFGGSGLGLAICKGLCEKMNGKIWVESQVGLGSTFSFTFRAGQAQDRGVDLLADPFATINQEMGIKHPLRILVVEDNCNNQLVAIGLLEKLGYLADVAENGRTALDCLERSSYDLVFMDCHMPELDGFETTTRILTKFQNACRPRIVALTASTMKEDIDRCFDAGMDDFIGKPLTLKSLVRVLNESKKLSVMTNPLPSYDRSAFLRNFKGMEDLARDTVLRLVRSTPKMLSEIEEAISSGNARELEMAAHNIKGAVSHFYAEPSKLLAWQLEQMGQGNRIEGSQQIFSDLKNELRRLQGALLNGINRKKSA